MVANLQLTTCLLPLCSRHSPVVDPLAEALGISKKLGGKQTQARIHTSSLSTGINMVRDDYEFEPK